MMPSSARWSKEVKDYYTRALLEWGRAYYDLAAEAADTFEVLAAEAGAVLAEENDAPAVLELPATTTADPRRRNSLTLIEREAQRAAALLRKDIEEWRGLGIPRRHRLSLQRD
jgi:hypothetical protein